MSLSPIVFISGATSGLGRELVYLFSKHKYRIIMCGRSESLLAELKNEIEDKDSTECITIKTDLNSLVDLKDQLEQLPSEWSSINVLINNAGIASISNFENLSLDEINQMIDVNIKATVGITHLLLPHLKRSSGHIINIGSIAKQEAFENGNVYSSSKLAIDHFSKCLRNDLLMHNIRVSVIHPGYIRNDFVLKSSKSTKSLASFFKGFQPLEMTYVAELVYFMASQPSSVCIDELTVTPSQQSGPKNIYRKNSV